jgi:hypothetical protein
LNYATVDLIFRSSSPSWSSAKIGNTSSMWK